MPFSLPQNPGAFIPTTQVWDITPILQSNIDPELKELFVRLYQNLGFMSDIVNIKMTGQYPEQEFVISSQFFPNPANSSTNNPYVTAAQRQIFRMTVNTGALVGGTITIAHNIPVTNAYTFVYIGGVASDTIGFNYYPFNYASASGNDLRLYADATNLNIVNNTGINFTNSYVILEYITS
jgi:hypothetical protein